MIVYCIEYANHSNYLTIRVDPEAGFTFSLFGKKPGTFNEIVPVKMDFSHTSRFGPMTPEAYEIVMQEVVKGEQSISVRFDEIEAAWSIVDYIRALQLPLYPYQKSSKGPAELETLFAHKHGMRWRS